MVIGHHEGYLTEHVQLIMHLSHEAFAGTHHPHISNCSAIQPEYIPIKHYSFVQVIIQTKVNAFEECSSALYQEMYGGICSQRIWGLEETFAQVKKERL